MKIGIFDPYLDSLSGGEKYMLTAATCLVSLGHDVSIFWDKESERQIKVKAWEKLAIDISKITFEDNIFAKEVSLLVRFLKARKYEAIVFLSDGSIPFVASKLFVHFQFPVEWVDVSWKTKLKISRVDKFICNSQFTKSFIDRKFAVQSVVLYPPVPLPGVVKKNKENIILHVGRFGRTHEGKNFKKQDVMIEMFKKMVKAGLKKWQFALVISVREEDEEEFNKLEEQAKGFPIELIKNPQNNQLWQLYAKAKIYWHSSGFGEDVEIYPERAEHFGIATVEAMGMGVVPVVIGLGGQKEIVDDGENGFLWKGEEECIKKTIKLIDDKTLLTKMAKKAMTKAKVFNIDRFCKELLGIIR